MRSDWERAMTRDRRILQICLPLLLLLTICFGLLKFTLERPTEATHEETYIETGVPEKNDSSETSAEAEPSFVSKVVDVALVLLLVTTVIACVYFVLISGLFERYY